MKFCQLIIMSKNKHSITKFINTSIKNKSLDLISQFLKKKNLRKIVTVLKSPHVHKIAQEQFEEKTLINCINIKSPRLNNFLILLKKILINVYPDLKISINFKIYTSKNLTVKTLDPLKFSFEKNKKYKNGNFKFFVIKNNKTKFFNLYERFKMLIFTKNSLKHFENYSLN